MNWKTIPEGGMHLLSPDTRRIALITFSQQTYSPYTRIYDTERETNHLSDWTIPLCWLSNSELIYRTFDEHNPNRVCLYNVNENSSIDLFDADRTISYDFSVFVFGKTLSIAKYDKNSVEYFLYDVQNSSWERNVPMKKACNQLDVCCLYGHCCDPDKGFFVSACEKSQDIETGPYLYFIDMQGKFELLNNLNPSGYPKICRKAGKVIFSRMLNGLREIIVLSLITKELVSLGYSPITESYMVSEDGGLYYKSQPNVDNINGLEYLKNLRWNYRAMN